MKESLFYQICHIAEKDSNNSLEVQNSKLKEAFVRVAMDLIKSREEVERLKVKEKISESRTCKGDQNSGERLEVSITK